MVSTDQDPLVRSLEALLDGLKMQAEITKQQHDLYMKRFDQLELMLEILLKYQNLLEENNEPH